MPKPAKQIAAAARSGDEARALKLLKRHPEAAKDWQPLMDACFFEREKLVAALLKAGADPNVLSKTNHRHRPLHRVIEHKKTLPKSKAHERIAGMLLKAGADPLLRGTHANWSAVALAACGGEPRFVPLLEKQLKRPDIWTAAAFGDLARVEALLKQDQQLATARDETGWTPLLFACASRRHQAEPKYGTALREIAKRLLKLGASANEAFLFEGKWPLPALYWATGWANHPELAEILLKAGANPHDGESLHHSAEGAYTRCLELLVEHGCDLNHKHETARNTALHFVIMWTSIQGVPWLLEHGADPNLKCGKDQETALHAAARRGLNEKFLKLLLDHGAKLDLKNGKGLTPFQVAQQAGKRNAAAFLKAQVR
ncbi:MAG: ankyrin repeat domain-containing protein [Planctomycetota bacterium]|nr:ankyrin repeat domain-containing protein [Planctomycetota bacterium]